MQQKRAVRKTVATDPSRNRLLYFGFALALAVVSLFLVVGGFQLVLLGGSWYYLLAGSGLLGTAILLGLRKSSAFYLFLAIYSATVLWALWEAGFSFWPMVPRLVPFLVMGAIMGFLWIGIDRTKRLAALSFAVVQLLLIVATGVAVFTPLDMSHGVPKIASATVPSHGVASDWRYYASDAGGTHYSPQDQITPDNVKDLEVAWTFRTGYEPEIADFQVTPLQIGNNVFLCTPHNVIFSLNAATGEQNWTYDPGVQAVGSWNRCRGVGYFETDPDTGETDTAANDAICRQRVIGTTVDATMFALDANTGEVCTGFGQGGTVDLTEGLGEVTPGIYFLTSAPMVADGHVIVGGYVTDNQSTDQPGGVVRSYSATTGAFEWAWDPGADEAPSPEQYARSTPNFWGTATYDASLGLVYIPTGNGTPDFWGAERSEGTDQFSTSIVALRAQTGELAWSYQTIHHDLWDWDLAAPPAFVDMPDGSGGTTPALIAVGKAGQIFVLDRATGEPLTEVEERPVPQNGPPGELLSPTQPYSIGMPQIVPTDFTEASMWGMTFFDQLSCRIAFQQVNYEGQYTPVNLERTAITPGLLGGFNWGGVAIDPTRNMLIVNDIRMASTVQLIPNEEVEGGTGGSGHGGVYLGAMEGTPYYLSIGSLNSPLGLPCQQPSWGKITGIDLDTRTVAWQIPAGTASGTLQDMIGFAAPVQIGMPTLSSATTTASGVTFYAGFNDEHVRAMDTATGKELWSAKLPVGSQATPMTYVSPETGKQYLLVAAGGVSRSSRLGDYVIAYALP